MTDYCGQTFTRYDEPETCGNFDEGYAPVCDACRAKEDAHWTAYFGGQVAAFANPATTECGECGRIQNLCRCGHD